MFNSQYEFFIEDFEKKLGLIGNAIDELKLIKYDLSSYISELFVSLGQFVNFRNIEVKVGNLQKLDIDNVSKAMELFKNDEFSDAKFILPNGKEILFKDTFDSLLKSLDIVQENEKRLGLTEILFPIEFIMNRSFQEMIIMLGDKAPIDKLQDMIVNKLAILTEIDIKILWSYVKEEFRDNEFGFEYDEEILEKDFFKVDDVKELRAKIARYITYLRPKLVLKRIKNGKTTSPIFSFGIARILALHESQIEDLTFNELTLVKIVNRILDFWDQVLHEEKDILCAHIGISPDGYIALLKPRDIDHSLEDDWGDFGSDKIKSYRIILFELRRLLKIADCYITRQTDIEKALFQYKLGYEIFAKENNKRFKSNKAPIELTLQKELCKYLLERGIYSYGKSFGTHEIDLMVEQPGKIYVLETKIYKSNFSLENFERHIRRDFIQLSEYLDIESSSAYGILVIYNLTDVLLLMSKQWISKRIWILPINITSLTPSKRKQSIKIEESDKKPFIRFESLDVEPFRRKKN